MSRTATVKVFVSSVRCGGYVGETPRNRYRCQANRVTAITATTANSASITAKKKNVRTRTGTAARASNAHPRQPAGVQVKTVRRGFIFIAYAAANRGSSASALRGPAGRTDHLRHPATVALAVRSPQALQEVEQGLGVRVARVRTLRLNHARREPIGRRAARE